MLVVRLARRQPRAIVEDQIQRHIGRGNMIVADAFGKHHPRQRGVRIDRDVGAEQTDAVVCAGKAVAQGMGAAVARIWLGGEGGVGAGADSHAEALCRIRGRRRFSALKRGEERGWRVCLGHQRRQNEERCEQAGVCNDGSNHVRRVLNESAATGGCGGSGMDAWSTAALAPSPKTPRPDAGQRCPDRQASGARSLHASLPSGALPSGALEQGRVLQEFLPHASLSDRAPV